jgi:Fe-S oxidoreductase
MAGSFGYEQEHYQISQDIGESRLFPAVRNRPEGTPVIANGFSCRHQIKDATGAKPMHIIEAIGRALLEKKD